MWQLGNFCFVKYSPLVILQSSNLRAIASFHEPVCITGACRELKNHRNDNIDSLPKSTASFERAMYDLQERLIQSSAHR